MSNLDHLDFIRERLESVKKRVITSPDYKEMKALERVLETLEAEEKTIVPLPLAPVETESDQRLTSTQAAEFLGVSKGYLAARRTRKFPPKYTRSGSVVYYMKSDLIEHKKTPYKKKNFNNSLLPHLKRGERALYMYGMVEEILRKLPNKEMKLKELISTLAEQGKIDVKALGNHYEPRTRIISFISVFNQRHMGDKPTLMLLPERPIDEGNGNGHRYDSIKYIAY